VPRSETRQHAISDDIYDEIADAANAEEMPIGSWLRIAVKEKLARERGEAGKSPWRIAGPVPRSSDVDPAVEEELRGLSKDIAEQTESALDKRLQRDEVPPRFKKGQPGRCCCRRTMRLITGSMSLRILSRICYRQIRLVLVSRRLLHLSLLGLSSGVGAAGGCEAPGWSWNGCSWGARAYLEPLDGGSADCPLARAEDGPRQQRPLSDSRGPSLPARSTRPRPRHRPGDQYSAGAQLAAIVNWC
jgi:hypothetical protein